MSEYFVRLATLLGTDFPEKLPVLGYIARNVGVRQWRETWNDTSVVISAEAVIDAAISWEKGATCRRTPTRIAHADSVINQIAMFHLASLENLEPIYVHAKLVIVDDTWFTIGSANLTRRAHD